MLRRIGCALIFTCVLLCAQSASASVTVGSANTNSLSSGLVGYWTFDGPSLNWKTNTASDASGQGNTGSLINMSTSTSPVAGKIGQALKFNGSSSEIDTNAGFVGHLTSFSVSLWAYPTVIAAQKNFFFNLNGGAGDYPRLMFASSSGNLQLQLRTGGVTQSLISTNNLSPNKWANVVVTFDGSTNLSNMYINGTFSTTTTFSAGSLDGIVGQTFRIGHDTNLSKYFSGNLDDVRIYNRALSAQEVQQLYASGSANVAHSNTVALSNGLVGYWTFDGPSLNWKTNTASDSSGNGNTGTLGNMSTTTSPVPGKIGQALSTGARGAGQISIPNSTSINTNNTLTVAFWIRGTPSATSYASVLQKTDFYTGWGIFQSVLTKSIYMRLDTTASNNQIIGTITNVLNGSWHHVVYTLNSGTDAVYKDGVLVTGGTYNPGTGFSNSQAFAINTSAALPASFDDVRIYNRALSAQEVQQLYQSGTANINHSNTVALSNGLVGYWTFDGPSLNWKTNTVSDVSGNGNTGSLVSMSTTTSPVAGKIGGALKFNGANDVFLGQITNAQLGITNTQTVSISTWVYPASFHTDNDIQIVFTKARATGASGASFGLGFSFGRPTASFSDGTNLIAPLGTTLTTNKWYHLMSVLNGTTAYIYVNGVLNATASNASFTGVWDPSASSRVSAIGADSNNTRDFFGGTIDDVRIYNRALSAQEVAQLYLMGK